MQHKEIKNMTGNFIEMENGFRRPNIYLIKAPKKRLDIMGERQYLK